MIKLKINLDDWAESVLYDDPDEVAASDLLSAAQSVSVMLEGEGHPQLSIEGTLRKHPELVSAHNIQSSANLKESSSAENPGE